MKTLTIFTPTYNRRSKLDKLYTSMLNQSCKDFVWLIVDDGSTDNTEALINDWIREGQIEIAYFYQSNRGKMNAHNKGVSECKTPLFVCVDSDDYLERNAVETILEWYREFGQMPKIGGFVAYKRYENGKLLSSNFPEINVCTLKELYKKSFKGDTSLVYKSEVLKQFEFPVINGEKFITENYLYYQIDKKYQLSIVPQSLIVCEYLDDGYSKNIVNVIKKNPKGYILYYQMLIKDATSFADRFKYSVALNRVLMLSGVKNKKKYYKNKLLYYLSNIIARLIIIKRGEHCEKSNNDSDTNL